MTLEDFEKELTVKKSHSSHRKRERSKSGEKERRHRKDKDRGDRHRHHHYSRTQDPSEEDERRQRKYKRSRRDAEDSKSRYEQRGDSNDIEAQVADVTEEDEWVEKDVVPTADRNLDQLIADSTNKDVTRDAWMQAPSSLDVDYVNKSRPKSPKSKLTKAFGNDYNLKIHENELNYHLRDPNNGRPDSTTEEVGSKSPLHREVGFKFGDPGSSWRMTKLQAVYRQAKESGRSVDDIALERYGNIRDFDDAREEEVELDRRKLYGKDYVGKEAPSGELYQERKLKMGITKETRRTQSHSDELDLPQGEVMEEEAPPAKTVILDQTALNKLKAQMMKARLRGATNTSQLEAEYNEALAASANRSEADVVILGAMDSRLLAGRREGEINAVETKRGKERGLVEESEDMSIDDMVRQERRTRGQAGGEGLLLAERIAKDAKFDNDLEYMDENAAKLAKRVAKSEINLRNMAIGDFQKMNKILDSCPLCHHEDTNKPPVAPMVSLATRVYLTLPTEPEISEGGACIVPIQHRINLLECDDDEWEETRNFMKCLTRMYHDQGRDVVFYENAAAPERKRHAAMQVVPLPYSLGETAPAFFKEAILSADEEWTQHKKIIDTLKRAKEGGGKLAFRRTLAKEMPYFHVWFELDGGIGHIVEDSNRWPKGDLFAREIIGGMLDVQPDIIKRQGRWNRADRRVDGFKKRWRKFDWTRVLTDG